MLFNTLNAQLRSRCQQKRESIFLTASGCSKTLNPKLHRKFENHHEGARSTRNLRSVDREYGLINRSVFWKARAKGASWRIPESPETAISKEKLKAVQYAEALIRMLSSLTLV